MTTIAQIILAIALVLSIILPFGYYLIGEKNRGRYKTALGVNAFFFFGTMLIAIAVMFTGASSVQAAAGSEGTLATGMGYIAASSCNRTFLYRWWYCRCQCGKRSLRRYQRGSEYPW